MVDQGINNVFLSNGVLGAVVLLCIGAIIALWRDYKLAKAETIVLQAAFMEKQAEQQEKYRAALENTNKVLDSIVRMNRGGAP